MSRRPIANEPLGLSRGSVRAVLAILLTTAAVCLAFAGRLDATFATIVNGVLVFYFAGRQGSPTATGITVTSRKEPTDG